MMEKFGFNAKPPIDLPEELSTSGVVSEEKLLTAKDPVDLARVAIGQERLLATPLQMAEVVSAVANGGHLMKPQIWNHMVNADGSVTNQMHSSEYSQPVSAKTAAELTTAMEGVVREGTGTNAAIPGVQVAGRPPPPNKLKNPPPQRHKLYPQHLYCFSPLPPYNAFVFPVQVPPHHSKPLIRP